MIVPEKEKEKDRWESTEMVEIEKIYSEFHGFRLLLAS
jgi:hypothetical protein